MRGKNGISTITDKTINRVKRILNCGLGIRQTAQRVGISYYTAWCIAHGKYDTKEPLKKVKPKSVDFFDVSEHRCWMVGGMYL